MHSHEQILLVLTKASKRFWLAPHPTGVLWPSVFICFVSHSFMLIAGQTSSLPILMYHINALVTNLLQLVNQVVEPDQGMTVWDILAYHALSWANIVSFDKSIGEVLASTPPVSSDLVFYLFCFTFFQAHRWTDELTGFISLSSIKQIDSFIGDIVNKMKV